MFKSKSLIISLSIFVTAVLILSGCKADTSVGPHTSPVTVDPPTNIELLVDAVAGGGSYALITWDPSASEGVSGFNGYRIITYILDTNNNITSTFKNDLVSKNTHTETLNNILRGTRYISFVRAELTDGTKSDSVATKIYGGVYYNNDGVIDEFTPGVSSAKSGYGWNTDVGSGTQYSFTTSNAASIDIHMRYEGGLKFYSPVNYLTGGKTTLYSVVDTGQAAFGQTTLDEPTFSVVEVSANTVYLIKTQENYYIKIWIKSISQANNIYTAYFDYKVQPIVDLKLVKK